MIKPKPKFDFQNLGTLDAKVEIFIEKLLYDSAFPISGRSALLQVNLHQIPPPYR